ncbi:GIY-YIG nuclease family protein [Alteromonas sp. S005]|uniref:GIY-YIG nuclease family protein n=1 Tax=Alteromonas sp. S005 TaxID=3117400 RepID=UPI002FE358CA
MYTEVRFYLANSLTPDVVTTAKYVVYGHECAAGLYIGYTVDPARRWQEHVRSASEKTDRNYNNNFKSAIRRSPEGFKHFILAVASTEKAAQLREAAAIQFYKPKLNTREPSASCEYSYPFRALSSSIVSSCVMKPKNKKTELNVKSDSDRVTVEAIVFTEGDKKRLKTLKAAPFERVMNISCHKASLDEFPNGTVVKLKVAPCWWHKTRNIFKSCSNCLNQSGKVNEVLDISMHVGSYAFLKKAVFSNNPYT